MKNYSKEKRHAMYIKKRQDQEFKECWALSNLQPLEAIANIKKGNKYLVG